MEAENERLISVLSKLQGAAEKAYKDITDVRQRNNELKAENESLIDQLETLNKRIVVLENAGVKKDQVLARISASVRRAVSEFNTLKIKHEEESLQRQYAEDRVLMLEDQLKVQQQALDLIHTVQTSNTPPLSAIRRKSRDYRSPQVPLPIPSISPIEPSPQSSTNALKQQLRETKEEMRKFKDLALNPGSASSSPQTTVPLKEDNSIQSTSSKSHPQSISDTPKQLEISRRSGGLYRSSLNDTPVLNSDTTANMPRMNSIILQENLETAIKGLKKVGTPKERTLKQIDVRPSSQFIVGSVGELTAFLAQSAIKSPPVDAKRTVETVRPRANRKLSRSRSRKQHTTAITTIRPNAIPPPASSLPEVPNSPDVTKPMYTPEFKDENLNELRALFDGLERELRKPSKRHVS